jgi:hypothetical protein
MTAGERGTDEEPGEEPHHEGVLVLHLTLVPGDPLRGTVGLRGRSAQSFCGWIDFMAAINMLRGAGTTTEGAAATEPATD